MISQKKFVSKRKIFVQQTIFSFWWPHPSFRQKKLFYRRKILLLQNDTVKKNKELILLVLILKKYRAWNSVTVSDYFKSQIREKFQFIRFSSCNIASNFIYLQFAKRKWHIRSVCIAWQPKFPNIFTVCAFWSSLQVSIRLKHEEIGFWDP